MARKKSQKNNRNKKGWGFGAKSQSIETYLQKFARHIGKEEWSKARDLIEIIEEHFPTSPERFQSWLVLAKERRDWVLYQQKAIEYTQNYPDKPQAYLTLSLGCKQNDHLISAIDALQTFCQKFPEHHEFSNAQQEISELKIIATEVLEHHLENNQLTEEELFERVKLNEQGRFWMDSHEYEKAIFTFQELINMAVDFAPAYNNLSLVYSLQGKLSEAIALQKKVLAFEPENFQALGNLVRFHVLLADQKTADKYLQQLKQIKLEILECRDKKAEALAMFGDWQGLVDLHKEVETAQVSPKDLSGLFWHCVAVGYANLGKQAKARELWYQCLDVSPTFTYAQDNLENLRISLDKQHNPWAFTENEWLSQSVREDIRQLASQAQDDDSEDQAILFAEQILEKHPEFITLAPIFLRRGNPPLREIIIGIATLTKKPELVEIVKDYAFGKDGYDRDRIEAVQSLNRAGIIPSGSTIVWQHNQQQEIMLMGIELTDEPTVPNCSKVKKLLPQAVEALRDDDGKKAEEILQKALQIEPSAPNILFNLANSYVVQEQEDRAIELIKKIRAEHPDYYFATLWLANYNLEHDGLEEAEKLIKTIYQATKLHFQEFALFCEVNIKLAVEKEQQEGALTWLNMWESIGDEHNPRFQYWSKLLKLKDFDLDFDEENIFEAFKN